MVFHNVIEGLLADKVKIRTFRTLQNHPQGLTGRGIASLVGTSPFKISLVLRQLVSEGILDVSSVGKAHLYQINQNHIVVRDIIFKLLNYEKNLLDQLGTIVMESLSPKPLSVILYGSIARGEETPASDIDLCLVYADDDSIQGLSEMIGESSDLDKIHRTFGNPVSTLRIKVSETREREKRKDPLWRKIVKEGQVIAGLSTLEILIHGGKKK